MEKKITDFVQYSYSSHSKTYTSLEIEEQLLIYKDWFNRNTTDVWRHLRYLDLLLPLINAFPDSKWLTVADGRFGTSAMYLEKNNIDVLATDIDDSLLKVSVNEKMIKKFQYENAESLSFDDNSFDFSFCKEAFHHFPQPYKAIYEMLRVSKKAVILSEPRDWIPSPFILHILVNFKRKVYRMLGIFVSHIDEGNYEESGNYVYTISEREISKIAMAQNFRFVAFKKMHDIYINGVENEDLSTKAPLYKKIKRKLFINKVLSFFTLSDSNRLFAIIFKEEISKQLQKDLKKSGYTINKLAKNPFYNT